MRIDFQIQYPKPLKGFFIYERTNHAKRDIIDEVLIDFAKTISTSPFEIDIFSNFNLSDLNNESFNSIKTVELTFTSFKKGSRRIIPLKLYINRSDKDYIDMVIKKSYNFDLKEEDFGLLDSLIL